jgi:hypothetical protein
LFAKSDSLQIVNSCQALKQLGVENVASWGAAMLRPYCRVTSGLYSVLDTALMEAGIDMLYSAKTCPFPLGGFHGYRSRKKSIVSGTS